MLCFRDRTFCSANCDTSPCDRKLTKEVVNAASRWWGKEGAPIAKSDFSRNCEEYKEVNDE